MTAFDPWLPPRAVPARPEPSRSPVLPIAIGVLAILVLVGGLARVVSRDQEAQRGNTAKEAVKAWFAAAATGDAEAVRAAVAPSQRQYVSPTDPTGLGLRELKVEDLSIGDSTKGHLAPDQAYVEIFGGTVCREGACFELTGSGPDERAMAVREAGRWWSVAVPVRLAPRAPARAPVKSVVSRRLELTGGVTMSIDTVETGGNHSCRNLETKPFSLSDTETRTSLGVSPDEADDPPGADVIGPRLVSLSVGEKSWRPRGPVRLQRAADGRSGSLVIDRWPGTAFLGGPAPAPVSGRLTWTCADEG